MPDRKNSGSGFARLKSKLRKIGPSSPDNEPGNSHAHPPLSPDKQPTEPRFKRFLTDNPVAYQAAIDAAKAYASKLGERQLAWLFAKPFDATPGNPQYFRLMFDLLNILQTMRLPTHARILEVGSGPGWVTEILLMMGYSIDALEPSDDLIGVAQQRCAGLQSHYRISGELNVRFHQNTLEEIELAEQSFDAILFFDVLHHVVDEKVSVEKSFKLLKPGGCVGVVDPSWHPDFKSLENQMIEEMRKYGTLENPFAVEYIDELLANAGFVDIERYISVNGMFNAEQSKRPLLDFSERPMAGSNNLTARRPYSDGIAWPGCNNPHFKPDARLTLLAGGIDPIHGTATITIRIENTGQTLLDSCRDHTGHITFGLRQNAPGTAGFIKCQERPLLPHSLVPGETLETSLTFNLPDSATLEGWELDVVAESVFWFSTRGMPGCPIPVV